MIPPLDREAEELARQRQASLTKPPGSLGRLEEIACRMAAIQARHVPRADDKWIVVAAADHGVTAEGVSAYPSEVTAQMVHNFLSGGAAINVLARVTGAQVIIVDAGIAAEIPEPAPGLRRLSLGRGTANFTQGPAMSRQQAETAIDNGVSLADEIADEGADLVAAGEMGIGNSTAAAAITSAFTRRPPREITGRGTGVDEAGFDRKVGAVARGLAVNRPAPDDPVEVLAAVGGFEIGILAGLMLGAASRRLAIALDGFIATSAALIAHGLDPAVADYMFACHRSTEPGHMIALEWLGLEPILDLEMRLGEGTGAALGMYVIDAAVRLHNEMATFQEAAVSGPSHDSAPVSPHLNSSPLPAGEDQPPSTDSAQAAE